jgi:hypothetical protein
VITDYLHTFFKELEKIKSMRACVSHGIAYEEG